MFGFFNKTVKEYKLGYKLYGLKQYKEAFPHLQYAADKGHIESQFLVGDCYDNGYGIVEDVKKAMKWYEKAGNQGHAESQYRLGMMYADVMGMLALASYNSDKSNKDKKLFNDEIFDGIASTLTKWASDPKESSGFEKSRDDIEAKTEKWLCAAAKQGHKLAQKEYKDLFE